MYVTSLKRFFFFLLFADFSSPFTDLLGLLNAVFFPTSVMVLSTDQFFLDFSQIQSRPLDVIFGRLRASGHVQPNFGYAGQFFGWAQTTSRGCLGPHLHGNY